MAALPPQPPGGMPPEPPGVAPPGGPPAGPPQGPYSPGGAYAGQMPAQPYVSQPMPQPVVVKVHKRTFWLTIAQIIIIVFAIARILLGILAAGIGVLFLTAGRARIESLPGYDQAAGQLGNGVINVLAAFLFAVAAYWLISGIIDLILGIVVGRPSNVARWFIIVLDVISLLYVIDLLTRGIGGAFTLVPLVFLVGKVIVLYALLIDPATRRNFAGTAR
ncbi:MAG: hypothetical protein WB807_10660 [Candidatus Dormiibacterota bacterium]